MSVLPVQAIRLSQKAREQLIRLKRHTGLKQWNVLCRWAFCTSLAEPAPPPDTHHPADSSVEMSWRVFGGRDHAVYLALLKQRCMNEGLGTMPDVLAAQFRLHLHRGISYLAGDRGLRSIAQLLGRVAGSEAPAP